MNIYFHFLVNILIFPLAERFSKNSEILSECFLVWIFSHLFYLTLSRLHLIKEFYSLAHKKVYSIIISLVIYHKNIGSSPTISIIFLNISYTFHLFALSSEGFSQLYLPVYSFRIYQCSYCYLDILLHFLNFNNCILISDNSYILKSFCLIYVKISELLLIFP